MENTKYVTINDLRERWLKQQHNQEQHQQEEEEEEELTAKKYVTIVDLRERWLKQQKQVEVEEENDKSQEDLKLDIKKPQFQNPDNRKPPLNPNLIKKGEGEKGFRRNPNWKNRRPFHGEKISEIENEIDCGGQLNDDNAQEKGTRKKGWNVSLRKKLSKERKRIRELENRIAVKNNSVVKAKANDSTQDDQLEIKAVIDAQGEFKDAYMVKDCQKKLRRNMRSKNKRNRLINGETHNVVTDKRDLAMVKGTEVLEISENGVYDSTGDNVVELNHISGLVMPNVMKKNRKCWKKGKGRIPNQEIEVKMKQFPVSGTRNVVQERWIPKSKGNVKEVRVVEKEIQVTEDGNVSKNERVEMRYGDRRTRGNRRIEVEVRGRRVYKSWNEGNRDSLMWVKKGDAY